MTGRAVVALCLAAGVALPAATMLVERARAGLDARLPTTRPDVAPEAVYDLRQPGYPATHRVIRWTDPETGAACVIVQAPTGSDSVACIAPR